MLLDKNKVFKVETVTIAEFIEKYHNGVTPQAIKYAIEKDLVDYVKTGKVYLVVLTPTTLAYAPNSSKKREESTMGI